MKTKTWFNPFTSLEAGCRQKFSIFLKNLKFFKNYKLLIDLYKKRTVDKVAKRSGKKNWYPARLPPSKWVMAAETSAAF